jgi:phage tail sheath gpL-like
MSITFNTVPASAIASGVFIEQEYKRSGVSGPIPERVAFFAQYNSGYTPNNNVAQNVTSADEVKALAGRGSMAARMAERIFQNLGAGSIVVDWFPLAAGTGSSEGLIEIVGPATGAGTLSLYIGGDAVQIDVESGDSATDIATALAAAINADLDLPVTATSDYGDLVLTAKNTGLAGDQIDLRMDYASGDADNEPAGVTVNITAMDGGTTNPSIETALTNLAGTFYTFIACPFNDDTSLDLLETSGDYRIGPAVKKPFAGICGYNDTRTNYLTWLDSRNSPWTTSVPVESSPDHPAEIAAAAAGRCALLASSAPSRPFKNTPLTGIHSGNVAPWTYAQKDAVAAAGGSATKDVSGVIYLDDMITTYVTNPLGAIDESLRYTVTISNMQAKIYSLDQLFNSAPFDRAVVVDDDSVTSKEYAISPRRVKGYIIKLVDEQWIPEAWSKNRDTIVEGIICEINGTNAGRIDVFVPDVLAPGLRIVAAKYQWSFGG